MDENDEQDRYVAQLQEVFNSCDSNGSGYLDRHGITLLCQQLQLDEQAPFFVQHLLKDDPNPLINFKEFKDEFISLLTHSIGQAEPAENVASPEREISPKYVHGNKKYGRRSQPESQDTESGEERISDVSDSEVFYNECLSFEESGIDGAYADMDIMEHDGYPERGQFHTKGKNYGKRRKKSNGDTKTFMKDESLSQKCEENEPDYLRDVWRKLAVGTDGYLDLMELERVCEHIGMEKMSQEVVGQLFAKLDTDHDGKISFEEFVNVFQSGETTATRAAAVANASIAKDERCETTIGNIPESGMFSSLDLQNTGVATAEAVIDLWESLGFSNGHQMLKDLGMGSSSSIRLQDLSNILEEALVSCDDPQLRQMALATMNWELRHLRNCLDQLKTERDKLKTDITEANSRAVLLAQEVDDQNAKLERSSANKVIMVEKKCKEQIQTLIEDHTAEREQLNSQILKLRQTLDYEEKHWRQDDNQLKEKLDQEEKENARLDCEIRELTEKLAEMEKLNQRHQSDLESLSCLRQKLDDLESGELVHESKYKEILADIEQLKLENQRLTDCNDELALKVESLQQQLSARPPARHTPSHKRNGSWLGEYVQNTSAKRRGNGLSSTPSDDSVDNSQKMAKVRSKSPEVFDEYATDMDDYDPYEDDSPYDEVIPAQPLQTPVSSVFEMKQVFQFLKNKMYSEFMNECEDDMMLSVKNLENRNDLLQVQLDELKVQHEQELEQCRDNFQRTFELEVGKWRKKWLDLQSEVEKQLDCGKDSIGVQTEDTAVADFDIGAATDDEISLKHHLKIALEQLQCTLMREEKVARFYEHMWEERKKDMSSSVNMHSVRESGDTFQTTNVYNMDISLNDESDWLQQQKETLNLCRFEQNQSKQVSALLCEVDRLRKSHELTNRLLNESDEKYFLQKEQFLSLECALNDEIRTLRKLSADLTSRCSSLEHELSCLRTLQTEEAANGKTDDDLELVREQQIEVVQELETFWKTKLANERAHHDTETIRLRNRIVSLESKLNELLEDKPQVVDTRQNCDGIVQHVATADAVVLEANHQVSVLQSASTNGSEYSTAVQTVDSEEMVTSKQLVEELRCVEDKCRALEEHAKLQTKNANKTLRLIKEQHQEEIHQLKLMLTNTQSVMKEQTEDYDHKLEKADELVQKLYLENAQLVKALGVTEERQKKAEQLNTHLHDRCNALTQLVSDIYKIT